MEHTDCIIVIQRRANFIAMDCQCRDKAVLTQELASLSLWLQRDADHQVAKQMALGTTA